MINHDTGAEQQSSKPPKFKIGIQGIKIILTIIAITMLFSGLNIYTGKMSSKAYIRAIEAKFENKDQRLMGEALSRCQADLTNRDEVRDCIHTYKDQLSAPYKADLRKMEIYGYLWWLFWGGVAVFVYQKAGALISLGQIFEIFKVLFDRTVVRKIKTILGKK